MAIRKIVSRSIGTDIIVAEDLANNSVTAAEITDGAVSSDKIASGAVTTAKISDDQITTAKIADNNVTVAKLPTTMDLSSNTVTLPDDVDAPVTLLHTGTFSGSASRVRWDLDCTNYRHFEVYLDDIVTASDATIFVNYANSNNGEPAGWYGGVYAIGEGNTSGYNGAFSNKSQCYVTDELESAVSSVYHFSGKFTLFPSTTKSRIQWHMVGRASTGLSQTWIGGALTTDGTNDWPKFILGADENITSVTYRVYGLK